MRPHLVLATARLLCVAVPSASAQLTYVEHSIGLQTPAMEMGDTEFEMGDVNGDGFVDLVSIGDHGSPYVNTTEHGIMVWFGNAAGTWTVFQYGNFGYGGVALGDINGDGLMDVAYGMHHDYSGVDLGDQLLEVALGNGTGQFWTPWDDGLASNGEWWGMFGTDLADVDNDGDLDLGAMSFGCCNGSHIYRNNGDGTWTQTFVATGGAGHNQFTFGDVNGDGYADFACTSENGTVYVGNGAGGFTQSDGNLPGTRPQLSVALGDVNDDGRDELAYVNAAGGILVYKWLGPSLWQNLSGNLPISGYSRVQIADMNLDGHGDIIAAEFGNPGQTQVFTGSGAGMWTLAATATHPSCTDIAAFRAGVDFDHNGYPDFIVVPEENRNTPRAFAEASVPTTPWVFPKCPRGGEKWIAGSVRFIDWNAPVPAGSGQPTMAIELSRTGPDGPFYPVAAGLPDNGRYQWRIPTTVASSTDCYLRLTLNTTPPAAAVAPAPFTIVNALPILPGDLNCDGSVNFGDINPFVLILTDFAAWQAAYPGCLSANGDINMSGTVGFDDINPFVALLSAASNP
jgi:hypothetical protein